MTMPAPGIGVRYLHERLQEANHLICVLLEQNEAQAKRIAEQDARILALENAELE